MSGRPRLIPTGAENDLYDETNPTSLINLLPTRLVPIFRRVRTKLPRMMYYSERELRMYLKPDERDDRLRLSFWDEYNASTASGKRMSMHTIMNGCCGWEVWVSVYEPNNHKMCWIFCPPASYANQMKVILQHGMDRLLEIMQLPLTNKDGSVNTKVATLVLKAWQLADMRVKGGIIQKMQVEQKTLQINSTMEEAKALSVSGMDIHELESLEKRIERAKRDQMRYLKELTPAQRESLHRGGEVLEDLENYTKIGDRTNFPAIPDLPDVPDVDVDLEAEYDETQQECQG
jgi:hypothetical protein